MPTLPALSFKAIKSLLAAKLGISTPAASFNSFFVT